MPGFLHLYICYHRLKEEIGSGQFGIVSKGEWQSRDCPIEVAVKTLKSNSSQEDKIKFLQEAAIMGQFANHYNVVKLYGVVISGEPVSTYHILSAV